MRKYIKAEDLIEWIDSINKDGLPEGAAIALSAVVGKVIIDMPAADGIKEKTYGTWQILKDSREGYRQIKCSICGSRMGIKRVDTLFRYCPQCGAEMLKKNNVEGR